MLRHGSLFSGIGGFDLAAEWMGWENVFHCEIDPFGQRVLKHHFPNSIAHEDIKELEATQYYGRVDIITGGFPCQPFSNAGQRKGTQDDRHLWPEMLRVISEVSPSFVVGENVRGLLNWSGPNGEPNMVFNQVCSDLEAEGYEVAPLVLPACGKNAPHRRDRIWFVAHSHNIRDFRRPHTNKEESRGSRVRQPNQVHHAQESDIVRGLSTDTDSEGLQRGKVTRSKGSDAAKEQKGLVVMRCPCPTWEKFPTQPPLCGRDDGIPERLDSISVPKWRRESVKSYGNAIVPQVAYEIFRAIQETYEDLH